MMSSSSFSFSHQQNLIRSSSRHGDSRCRNWSILHSIRHGILTMMMMMMMFGCGDHYHRCCTMITTIYAFTTITTSRISNHNNYYYYYRSKDPSLFGSRCRIVATINHQPQQQNGDHLRTSTRRLSSTTTRRSISVNEETTQASPLITRLTDEQITFVMGYLNKHHTTSLIIPMIIKGSSIGAEMAKANVWSGGSYTIVNATLVNILPNVDYTMEFNVTIQRRSQSGHEYRMVQIPLVSTALLLEHQKQNNNNSIKQQPRKVLSPSSGGDSQPSPSSSSILLQPLVPTTPIDDLVRLLCRWCHDVIDTEASQQVTGPLIQLAIQLQGNGIGKLPENMYLNQVPHNVYVRQWFYDQVAIAVHDAFRLTRTLKNLPPEQQQRVMSNNRQKVVTLFPETNPSMDSYRIGTLLEMIRTVTLRLVHEERLRVRICVQSSMGVGIFTGLPKQLSGVMKLLQLMDWQNDVGEPNEGIVGDYVRFGAIGPDHVMNTTLDMYNDTIVTQYQDDVFLIIAPQSMVGTDTSIIPLLSDMCTAIGTERPIILFNPDLTDKISSGGQQSVRGRQARIDFTNTFQTIFHFQNIYVSGTSYFPILGTITKLHPEEPWIAHQRRDYANNEGEVYVPVLAGERLPDGEMILAAFER